jgi:EAL domain-containing protein (putative c-di-GMP-specific phosphodiesterase class I)
VIHIPPISVTHEAKQFTVYPRVELITDCMSKKNGVYEVLCVINKGTKQTCSARFFSELSHQDTYTIYRHVLKLLTTQTTSAISLNTSLDFLKAHYVEMLLSEFVDVKLILELLETSPLHSIIQIEDRLNDIKEHPRVSIWLDDFGTERSNFDLVNKINFDAVKMSKELFWDLYENDKILLKYLMKMIKRKVNIMVVEGVDSFDKYIFCKEQQCLMQGYFFNEIKNSAVC